MIGAASVFGARRPRVSVPFIMLLLAAALVIVALTRPTALLPRNAFSYLFVLDITQSMNVQDAGDPKSPVRRIQWAQESLRRTLERLPCGSEAGLAIFTEYRALLLFAPVEVCEHFGTITTMLADMDWRLAWASRSEVAKGLYSSLLATRDLGEDVRLVFFTDGHEAPPLNPSIRPTFTGTPGEVNGAIIGVGGSTPRPIPRLNDKGDVIGYWAAHEVLQIDPFSRGRSSSVAGEQMTGIDTVALERRAATATEHLSTLREAYLKQLARETRLQYHRLESPQGLVEFLTQSQFARPTVAVTDLRWIPGTLAILAILLVYVAPMRSLLTSLSLAVLALSASMPGDVSAAEPYTRQRVVELLAHESPDLSNANLRRLDLAGLDFRGVNFRGADLSGASLRDCNLDLAILRDAALVGADLQHTSMFGTVLADADLTDADLGGARIVGNLTGANLENASLVGARAGADMRNQPMGLMRAVLAQAQLKGANLAGADLSRADLSFADLRGADLTEANLMHADLIGADLTGAQLANAVLTGADLENAVFRSVAGLDSVQGLEATVGRELATFD